MKRSSKVFLAVATFWPLAYGLFVLVFVAVRVVGGPSGPRYFMLFDSQQMAALGLMIHVACGLVSLAVFIWYLLFVHKSASIPADKKAFWTVLLVLGSVVTMPVIFFIYLWREPQSK